MASIGFEIDRGDRVAGFDPARTAVHRWIMINGPRETLVPPRAKWAERKWRRPAAGRWAEASRQWRCRASWADAAAAGGPGRVEAAVFVYFNFCPVFWANYSTVFCSK